MPLSAKELAKQDTSRRNTTIKSAKNASVRRKRLQK
jgi:hypothetical protein